jgi:hypothetical protein
MDVAMVTQPRSIKVIVPPLLDPGTRGHAGHVAQDDASEKKKTAILCRQTHKPDFQGVGSASGVWNAL